MSEYLGCIPILIYSNVWYSANDKIFEGSSQEYHLDHEDYKQIKGFLYLEDINEDNGAMNLFTKNSNKIIQQINYKTLPDRKESKMKFFLNTRVKKLSAKERGEHCILLIQAIVFIVVQENHLNQDF